MEKISTKDQYVALILGFWWVPLFILAACTSEPTQPERTMRNCKLIKDNYYICEEIPAHVQKDTPPERTVPHSNSYQH